MRGVVTMTLFYLCVWGVVALGMYCVARSVTDIPLTANEVLTVGSAQAVGYVAALVTLVAPAGLGIRDAAFAWAVKGAVGGSFAVGSLIAIAVRGVLTLAEQAKLWTEPAAGCLVPAALQVLERVGPDARLGLVICGGNVTFSDVAGWVARFDATPFPPRVPARV